MGARGCVRVCPMSVLGVHARVRVHVTLACLVLQSIALVLVRVVACCHVAVAVVVWRSVVMMVGTIASLAFVHFASVPSFPQLA